MGGGWLGLQPHWRYSRQARVRYQRARPVLEPQVYRYQVRASSGLGLTLTLAATSRGGTWTWWWSPYRRHRLRPRLCDFYGRHGGLADAIEQSQPMAYVDAALLRADVDRALTTHMRRVGA